MVILYSMKFHQNPFSSRVGTCGQVGMTKVAGEGSQKARKWLLCVQALRQLMLS
jgi:hypothetical protein